MASVADRNEDLSPEYDELEALRQAFGDGPTGPASLELTRALNRGVAWPLAVQASAEGLARHYNVAPAEPDRTERPQTQWRVLLLALVIYVALRPLIGFGHEITVAGIAAAARGFVQSGIWKAWIEALPVDPIYTGVGVRVIGGVKVMGVAVAGPIGAWLHAITPGVFLDPGLVVQRAGVSTVIAPGATAIGRGVAAFGADVVWIFLAVVLCIVGWKRGSVLLWTLGLLLQGQIALNHLLDAQVSLRDLEAAGLPFAVSLLMPGNSPWFTSRLADLPGGWQATLIGAMLVLLGYAVVLTPLAAGTGLIAGFRHILRRNRGSHPATGRSSAWIPVRATCALAVVAAVSPLGATAVGESNWHPVDPAAMLPAAEVLDLRTTPRVPAQGRDGPSTVLLDQQPGGAWQLLVNGRPEVVRGMGYNPQYASLPKAERVQRYDRDFGAMRQLGVNTIEGWFESQFDRVTLDSAARNGIGVIMPFELNQDWNYADPATQQRILDAVSANVTRYRNHPAVLMWAPGNENLHRVLYAKWVSQEHVPEARAKADAFSAFLPVLVDRIHELDPNHPVLYRDAEDVYLPRLKRAFEQTGVARPWLMYGANVYSEARLDEIINKWPRQWLGGPLLISEFAPGGVGPADRPMRFREYWQHIRARPDLVLGGLAYAWATNGPEELDRVFGLVDADGLPRDQSLIALGSAYLADEEIAQAANISHQPSDVSN